MAHQSRHLRCERLAETSEQVVRNFIDALPESGVSEALRPVKPEILLEQIGPLLRQESGDVNSIGDVANAVLRRIDLRPQGSANARRHSAMDTAHAVLKTRSADGERCHVEIAVLVHPAEGEKIIAPELELLT